MHLSSYPSCLLRCLLVRNVSKFETSFQNQTQLYTTVVINLVWWISVRSCVRSAASPFKVTHKNTCRLHKALCLAQGQLNRRNSSFFCHATDFLLCLSFFHIKDLKEDSNQTGFSQPPVRLTPMRHTCLATTTAAFLSVSLFSTGDQHRVHSVSLLLFHCQTTPRERRHQVSLSPYLCVPSGVCLWFKFSDNLPCIHNSRQDWGKAWGPFWYPMAPAVTCVGVVSTDLFFCLYPLNPAPFKHPSSFLSAYPYLTRWRLFSDIISDFPFTVGFKGCDLVSERLCGKKKKNFLDFKHFL